MKAVSVRTQRIALIVALFGVSFALYFAAESGSGELEIVLLGLLAALMLVAARIN